MANLRLRPRFAVEASCDAKTVVQALRDGISRSEPPLTGYFDDAHCVLRIPDSRRAFFSPELDLTFEPKAADGSSSGGVRVRCLFSPRPAIWTGFAFVYAMLALTGLAGLILGVGQLSVGVSPWGLLVPVATGVSIGLVYASSFIGQGLAASQMYQLRRALDEGLEAAEASARAEPGSAH